MGSALLHLSKANFTCVHDLPSTEYNQQDSLLAAPNPALVTTSLGWVFNKLLYTRTSAF